MTTATSSSSSAGGIGFFGLLTIVFIVLKLTHVINWSWWWVLAPSLIPLGICAVILAIMAIGAIIVVIKTLLSHKRRG